MKKPLYKVFLLISLLPYALILFYAIYSAISGIRYTFLFSSSILYGFEGFVYGLITGIIWLIFYPIIPICITYQIAYGVLRKKENKKPIWISTFAVAGIIFLLVIGWNITKPILERNRALEQSRIKEELRNNVNETAKDAEEVIEYGGTINGDGIAGTEFTKSTMFIDYDSKKVTFLLYVHGDVYREFSLSENKTTNNDIVRYKVELNYPGRTLTAFSLNDSERHKIVAIELRMEDGSVYSIDEIKDEYGRLGCFLDMW